MMAEAYEDMVTVIYEETTYNLIYIPSKNSLVVEEKTKSLEKYLSLEQFGKEEILRLGQLVQLAYFGVAGQADLQIKVRPALSIVSDLCDNVIHMLNGCKRSFHGVLIKIQIAYEYLDKSAESNALQVLKNMQPTLQNLSTALNSLSQKCSKQAEYLLQVHHIVKKEKQIVEDEARKQKMQLSDNKKEKYKCEIQIKKSTKIISQHNKRISSDKKRMSSISEKKEKYAKQNEKDIENARNKCESQLSKLKCWFESKCAKSSKDSKINKKKHASCTTISSIEEMHAKPSAHNQDKKVDHKLMQEESSCQDHLDNEHQGQLNWQLNDIEIRIDQESTQCSENKEPNLKIPSNTNIVEMNYTSSAKDTKGTFFNKTDISELQTITETKEDLEDTPNLTSHSEVTKTNTTGTPQSQAQIGDKSIKVASAKEKYATENLKVSIDKNKVGSTIASGSAKKMGAMESLLIKEQEEDHLQTYLSEIKQIELQTKDAKEVIQKEYQARIKKLDEQLENLDQQLKTSNTVIKENEQVKKDNQQKLIKLSESIAEMTKTIELNDTSIECISHTIAALYTIGSIMKKLGNFLKQFASLCDPLNECILFKQIKYLQNKKDLWKSNTFKREVLYCYRDYLAFTDICAIVVKYITQAQEEVYHNVSKDLSRDEVLKLGHSIMHKYMIEL